MHLWLQLKLLFTGLLYSTVLRLTTALPQCLDYFPPFKLEAEQVFCSSYREFGCCSLKRNNQLLIKYLDIVRKLNHDQLSTTCANSVKEMLCQECSPYSARIYEKTKQSASFPALCDSFCKDFYMRCKGAIKYLTDNGDISGATNYISFCNSVKARDRKYCYPEVNGNPQLKKALQPSKLSFDDDCLCLKEFARDLRKPLVLTSPDDGSRRIFVGTQFGKVFVYHRNGTRFKDEFLDITALVHTSEFRGDQNGLLGMIFHSHFKYNHKFYIFFNMKSSNGRLLSRISELKADKTNPNKADLHSIRTILDIEKPSEHNNGGQVSLGILCTCVNHKNKAW